MAISGEWPFAFRPRHQLKELFFFQFRRRRRLFEDGGGAAAAVHDDMEGSLHTAMDQAA